MMDGLFYSDKIDDSLKIEIIIEIMFELSYFRNIITIIHIYQPFSAICYHFYLGLFYHRETGKMGIRC